MQIKLYACNSTNNIVWQQGVYRKWCGSVNFESMLPGDVQAWKMKAAKENQTLNKHLKEKQLSECVVPYSDKIFRQAAIEWLIATDQVCLTNILKCI
jgi:hypothetical protein